MYFLHRVEIDPYRRRAAQPRSPARENFRRRVNHAFIAGNSYPAPGSVRGYPCVQLRLLRIHLRRRLLIPPRLPHPACALAGIPRHFFGIPHPARACGAPPPPPPGGGVRAWRYQGSSRAWGEPVGNRARFFSGISPCIGPWGYRHWGWGRRGGGTRSPSPVSHAPTILLLCRQATHTLLPASPTSPPPPGGAGSVRAYI